MVAEDRLTLQCRSNAGTNTTPPFRWWFDQGPLPIGDCRTRVSQVFIRAFPRLGQPESCRSEPAPALRATTVKVRLGTNTQTELGAIANRVFSALPEDFELSVAPR